MQKKVKRPVSPDRVLEYINAARGAVKAEPLKRIPKGVPEDKAYCPLAIALEPTGAEVGRATIRFKSARIAHKVMDAWRELTGYEQSVNIDDQRYVKLPVQLERFRRGVDAGRFPEFVDARRAKALSIE